MLRVLQGVLDPTKQNNFIVDSALGLQLVPWSREIEKKLGQHITGTAKDSDGIEREASLNGGDVRGHGEPLKWIGGSQTALRESHRQNGRGDPDVLFDRAGGEALAAEIVPEPTGISPCKGYNRTILPRDSIRYPTTRRFLLRHT